MHCININIYSASCFYFYRYCRWNLKSLKYEIVYNNNLNRLPVEIKQNTRCTWLNDFYFFYGQWDCLKSVVTNGMSPVYEFFYYIYCLDCFSFQPYYYIYEILHSIFILFLVTIILKWTTYWFYNVVLYRPTYFQVVKIHGLFLDP